MPCMECHKIDCPHHDDFNVPPEFISGPFCTRDEGCIYDPVNSLPELLKFCRDFQKGHNIKDLNSVYTTTSVRNFSVEFVANVFKIIGFDHDQSSSVIVSKL